ncbi:MAG TPA: AraC family transcriptional regulator [Bacilli bacterium]
MELITTGKIHYPGYRLMLSMHVFEKQMKSAPNGFYRISLVENGTGSAHVNGRSYSFSAPALFCFNHMDDVVLRTSDKGKIKTIFFQPTVMNEKFTLDAYFHQNKYTVTESQDLWCLKPFFPQSEHAGGIITVKSVYIAHISRLFAELGGLLRNQPDSNWPCRSRVCLFELLYFIRRLDMEDGAMVQPVPDEAANLLREVVNYLSVNYREKIRLDQLARQFHTNKTTLNQLFRKHLQQSVMGYLSSLRIQMACSMLHNTLLSTNEIMERVGYHDGAHFFRQFRSHTGLSPSRYRKANCWLK